jgi:hypothetical protein
MWPGLATEDTERIERWVDYGPLVAALSSLWFLWLAGDRTRGKA